MSVSYHFLLLELLCCSEIWRWLVNVFLFIQKAGKSFNFLPLVIIDKLFTSVPTLSLLRGYVEVAISHIYHYKPVFFAICEWCCKLQLDCLILLRCHFPTSVSRSVCKRVLTMPAWYWLVPWISQLVSPIGGVSFSTLSVATHLGWTTALIPAASSGQVELKLICQKLGIIVFDGCHRSPETRLSPSRILVGKLDRHLYWSWKENYPVYYNSILILCPSLHWNYNSNSVRDALSYGFLF